MPLEGSGTYLLGPRGGYSDYKIGYETPLTIEFNKGVLLLGSPRITRTVPDDLTASASVESGRVVLNPMTLNPGQSVSIFLLLSNFDNKVDVHAQIQNVELGKLRPNAEVIEDRRWRLYSILLVFLMLGAPTVFFSIVMFYLVAFFRDQDNGFVILLFLLTIMATLAIWSRLLWRLGDYIFERLRYSKER